MPTVRIGLISDTHGLLRPEAIRALQGVDHIIHAGDIGTSRIIEQLAEIAPVTAVRGNNDHGPWADALPTETTVESGKLALHVLHDIKDLGPEVHASTVQVVVSGHSHRPAIATENGILFVNPGSAGPRRFKLPISLAFLEITQGKVEAELRMLDS